MSKGYSGNIISTSPISTTNVAANGVYEMKEQYTAIGKNPPQWPGSEYEIGRSLRFRYNSPTYFERTPTVSGNRRTWTYSTWVKFGAQFDNGNSCNFGMSPQYGGDGSNECQMYTTPDGEIRVYDSGGSANYFLVKTINRFRDFSAWYHIVVAVDTTQTMAVDRVKIYVNGDLEPLNIEIQVSQNQNTGWNHTFRHRIGIPGYTTNSAQAHDGYVAEINHIDGRQLDASHFGYFDTVTGIWKPKKYTGTYGTNGFYLAFNDIASVSSLGRNANSNYVSYTEQFDNAYWTKSATSVTANAVQNPIDGLTTADKLTESATTAVHSIQTASGITKLASGTYTFSVYAKAAERTNISLQLSESGGGYMGSVFDLSAGTAYVYTGIGMSPVNADWQAIQAVGNGWYRCSVSVNTTSPTNITPKICLGGYEASYAGVAGSGVHLFGAMLNLGSTPGTYVPIVANPVNSDWTPVNFSLTAGVTYDSMVDSPTNVLTNLTDTGGVVSGNYCTINCGFLPPGHNSTPPYTTDSGGVTLQEGALTIYRTQNANYAFGTLPFPTSGKWYWEYIVRGGTRTGIGINNNPRKYSSGGGDMNGVGDYGFQWEGSQNKSINGSVTSAGSYLSGVPTTNDVIGIAYDADNGTLYFSRNGTWGNSGNPATGTNPLISSIPVGQSANLFVPLWAGGGDYPSSATLQGSFNFGQRPFAYTPPAGFKSLNTTNIQALGTSAVSNAAYSPNTHFDILKYPGTGVFGRYVSGLKFKPDFVWIKGTSYSSNHLLMNSVVGAGNGTKFANLTEAESYTRWISEFTNDGFRAGTNNLDDHNEIGAAYVAWNWKASSANVTNTAGSITSTVRVNQAAGFSIVSYQLNNSNFTVGHGLGAVPKLIIVGNRSATNNWDIYHSTLGPTQRLTFTTSTADTNSGPWNNTAPTSTVFSQQSSWYSSPSSASMIAYCWAEVPGFSKIGGYTGNGSSDGHFVYTGFRPKYVLFKRTNTSEAWVTANGVSDPQNPVTRYLLANAADSETNANISYDFLSNGFKFRNNSQNENGATYIYVAFAESPFALNNRAR
jgi:hypothetical protein